MLYFSPDISDIDLFLMKIISDENSFDPISVIGEPVRAGD